MQAPIINIGALVSNGKQTHSEVIFFEYEAH